MTPDILDELPWGERASATNVLKALEWLGLSKKRTLGEEITDRVLATCPALAGKSLSYIQKGLRGLQRLGLIDRVRQHGRRIIGCVFRLRGHGASGGNTDLAARGLSPPQTPPNTNTERTATTGAAASSSSFQSTPEKAPDDPALADLTSRACRLFPSPDDGPISRRVADVVGVFGAEWVAKALGRVEERNRKPGNKPVASWGFVLVTLNNWRKEGGPAAPPQVVAAPRAVPQVTPAEADQPNPLTPQELEGLIQQARNPNPTLARFGLLTIHQHIAAGEVSTELLATVPAEMLPQAGPEVPAARSKS
jgi:hypothetical protein